jgi:Icc protein
LVRFLHISDTHLQGDVNHVHYGHPTYASLKQLVATINALPYSFDFILHSGDVVDDEQPESYANAKAILAELRAPVHYIVGNHDNARLLQQTMVGIESPAARYDYAFELGGVQFVALDSTTLHEQPGGELTDTQLDWLRGYCQTDGLPLAVFIHHLPLPLGVPWLDEVIAMPSAMIISNHQAFRDVLRPAAKRLRGVFFGHIHRSSQSLEDGILYSSAPSTFGQLKTWPEMRSAAPAPEEAPGYCLVTIDATRTVVQQYTFARPD